MTLVKVFEFLSLLALIVQEKIMADAKRKESGKLDAIDEALVILKTSRDPEERKNAAIALHEARKL